MLKHFDSNALDRKIKYLINTNKILPSNFRRAKAQKLFASRWLCFFTRITLQLNAFQNHVSSFTSKSCCLFPLEHHQPFEVEFMIYFLLDYENPNGKHKRSLMGGKSFFSNATGKIVFDEECKTRLEKNWWNINSSILFFPRKQIILPLIVGTRNSWCWREKSVCGCT